MILTTFGGPGRVYSGWCRCVAVETEMELECHRRYVELPHLEPYYNSLRDPFKEL